MKYLKLFESVELFKEIRFDEFNKKLFNDELIRSNRTVGKNWVDFTDGEVHRLKKILDYNFINNVWGWMKSKSYITCNKKSSIFKLDDGWFYLTYYDPVYKIWRYYVCDQWDGLINCLTKITDQQV